jgi:hypothetical protein
MAPKSYVPRIIHIEFKMIGIETHLVVDIHAIQVVGLDVVRDEVGRSGRIVTCAGGIGSRTVCGNNKTDAGCGILCLDGSTRGGVQLGPRSGIILKASRVYECEREDVKTL